MQVVGIERAGRRQLPPEGDLELAAGDGLLVLGGPVSLARLERELAAGESLPEFTD